MRRADSFCVVSWGGCVGAVKTRGTRARRGVVGGVLREAYTVVFIPGVYAFCTAPPQTICCSPTETVYANALPCLALPPKDPRVVQVLWIFHEGHGLCGAVKVLALGLTFQLRNTATVCWVCGWCWCWRRGCVRRCIRAHVASPCPSPPSFPFHFHFHSPNPLPSSFPFF